MFLEIGQEDINPDQLVLRTTTNMPVELEEI